MTLWLAPAELRKQFVHSITVKQSVWYDAMNWCEHQFGKNWSFINNKDGKWTERYDGLGSYVFSFKDHSDAVLFVLRWA